MHIAITGGNGRIGRAVIELALAQGHTAVSIDRAAPTTDLPSGVGFVQADISSYEQVRASFTGCAGVVHLAAIPSPIGNPDHEVHNNNVVGSYNALMAAAELGITHICQASSVNATGAVFSRQPRYDYFPINEAHPTYNEDGYSLSKWICEIQADSVARRYEAMTIASLRFHWVVPSREYALSHAPNMAPLMAKQLWGYTLIDAAARACLQSLTANFRGHEVFQIMAAETVVETPSLELAQQHFPQVPIRGDLHGRRGLYDCSKAERLLGWQHE